LFINPSKVSLKDALLCKGNKFPSVTLAHTANIQESYRIIKILLEKIQYAKYNWKVCGDEVIALLLGLQLGCTKFCCFLLEWDFRARKHHYIQKQ
jgi:hypothetical protein